MRLVLCALSSVVWFPVLPAAPCYASPSAGRAAYVTELIERAEKLQLYGDKRWLRLLHYRRRSFAEGYRSEADGDHFFLAGNGRTDPRAELLATLRGFFEPPVTERPVGEKGPARHAICRFPARLFMLQRALAIAPRRLPPQRCPRFSSFLAQLRPVSASVVFSSYYLNNPASAFGHTFLRFNKHATPETTERRELLDYAVEFSATVDTNNSLVYALKGLSGMFPGTLRRMPYFYKVREYADAESRDVWDYELNLTPQELYTLVAHVWELGHTFFAYYYLDENCSYRINRILEAAVPDVDLTSDLIAPVLPADTIKALVRNQDLVRRVGYRPSLRTRFMRSAQRLTAEQRDLVELLARRPGAPLPAHFGDDARVAVLDAAADYIDMRHVKDLVFKRDSLAARRKQRLLERRAAIRLLSRSHRVKAPLQEQPHRGHDSRRLGLSVGMRDSRDELLRGPFTVFDLRLAMHDLADPTPGYPQLSAIEFLPARLRLWPQRSRPRFTLDYLALVRITSLTSVNRFETRLSWRFDTGLRTLENEGCRRCLAGYGVVGGGMTKAFWDEALALFFTLDTSLFVAGEPVGVANTVFRLGLGPRVGTRVRLNDGLVALILGQWSLFPGQPSPSYWEGDATLRWGLMPHFALSLEGRLRADRREAQVFLLSYL